MRGQKVLFDNLFEDKTRGGETKIRQAKQDSLLHKRNQLLCARYLYLKKHTTGAGAYEQIVKKMEEEFFLKTVHIVRLLEKNTDMLADYRQQNLSKKELMKRWPHLKW